MAKIVQSHFITELTSNLTQSPEFIQVILGPRQVGKTTGILGFLDGLPGSTLYFSADERISSDSSWIEEKWQEALQNNANGTLLIDEIQKVPDWPSIVKKLWDRQKRTKSSNLRLVLLGSSSLHIQQGLQESLTGRFQLIRAHHWDLATSRQLAKFSVDDFVKNGGYPGSYSLLARPKTWEKYIQDSIIETVIGKDILQIARVNKPALFRQAFQIIMSYPAQEISYTKLLGQLQDKGNTDLIKHYIELYEGAFLLKSLQKFSGKSLATRSSSPKLLPLCGALIDRDLMLTKEGFGRAVECAVGSALVNAGIEVYYWRDGNAEVDFIAKFEGDIFALEVKSGRVRSTKGMSEFTKLYKNVKPVYITENTLEKFR